MTTAYDFGGTTADGKPAAEKINDDQPSYAR